MEKGPGREGRVKRRKGEGEPKGCTGTGKGVVMNGDSSRRGSRL